MTFVALCETTHSDGLGACCATMLGGTTGFLKCLQRQAEVLELARPFRWSIAKLSDSDAAWKAAIDGGLDQRGSEECHRDRKADLPSAAFLAKRKVVDRDGARDDLVEPSVAASDGADQPGAPFRSDGRTRLL